MFPPGFIICVCTVCDYGIAVPTLSEVGTVGKSHLLLPRGFVYVSPVTLEHRVSEALF